MQSAFPAGLGFCQDLNLLSTNPEDVVQTCNTIYGLLLQHQKDSRFKDQLKTGGSEAELRKWRLNLHGGLPEVGPPQDLSKRANWQLGKQ